MALPAVIPAFFAAASPWIMRFLAAKAVIIVAGFLGRLGIVLATNEVIVQPLIEHVMASWNSIPAAMQCWFSLFGVTKSAGIFVSGLTLIAGKQVFFAKA